MTDQTSQTLTRAAVSAGAVAATAAFAGGGLLTQTVIVPQWRALEPQTFLDRFRRAGPVTGATLFPSELVGTVLLIATAMGSPGRARRWWTVAAGCMAGTIALLPLHFAPANRRLLAGDVPADSVPAELASWNAWNWLRTGLAGAAMIASCAALSDQQGPAA